MLLPLAAYLLLVVEQSHARKSHGDAILIATLYHRIVSDRTARLSDVGHAASLGSFDIIAEREESIAAQRYAADS